MLRLMAGPLIGAIIGYCTNYIAVKMLFYPRKAIHLFGWKLPFTPGAIPKGQKRLAHAIGNIVEQQLLTTEDMKAKLNSEETMQSMTMQITTAMNGTLKELGTRMLGEEAAVEGVKSRLTDMLTDEIVTAIQKAPLADIIVEKGSTAIKEMTAGTMLQMFLSDELIMSITEPVGKEIEDYINTNGKEYIAAEVTTRVNALTETPVTEMLTVIEPEQEKQNAVITSLISNVMSEGVESMLSSLGIAQMVEDKIVAMDVKELEELVLTVMKKELNTIVNLGALIGFLLGLLNLIL